MKEVLNWIDNGITIYSRPHINDLYFIYEIYCTYKDEDKEHWISVSMLDINDGYICIGENLNSLKDAKLVCQNHYDSLNKNEVK